MSHSSSSSSSLEMRDPVGPGLERPVLQREGAHRRDVESGGVVEASRDVGDRDHGRAAVDELLGGDPTDIAESLHDAPLLRELPAEPFARARHDHHDPRAGRLVAEHAAADRDRLARDDLRHRVAALHRVGVHHPGHRLLVRRHVRRGDVFLRPDEREQLRRESPGEALQLGTAQRPRIAAHAAFRAAVRQPEQRALPRHPDRERRALAEGDPGVVAHAALGGAEDARVLDPVAREHDAPSVVELDRARHDDRALGMSEPLGDAVVDVGVRDRLVELRDRRPEERRVVLEVLVRRHVLGARHGRMSVAPGGGNHVSPTSCL